MSLQPQSLTKENLQNLWAWTPKSFYSTKTSNLRDWNPKILKICELKTPEPYTGRKTLQIYELHTSKSYKRQALTLCELEGPKKMHKKHPQKLWA